jgi:cytochrome c-type biogenesis protein CcmH
MSSNIKPIGLPPIFDLIKIMRAQLKIVLALFVLLTMSLHVHAAIEAHEFNSDLERQRYQSFIEEMRCPKCQNQNLAGSDSPISADLRRELYEMIKMGKSDKEIVDYMVSRYGDFILYRPRVTPATYVLWIAPGALLVIGIIVLIVILRQRQRLALVQVSQELSAGEQARLASLLMSHDKKSHDDNIKDSGESRS